MTPPTLSRLRRHRRRRACGRIQNQTETEKRGGSGALFIEGCKEIEE